MSGIWLSIAIAVEIVATLSLRASDGMRKKRWVMTAFVGYAISFSFVALTLRAGMPVGVAYGIWTAVGIALIALFARAIWGDPLNRRMIVGIVIIAAGVLLIEVG